MRPERAKPGNVYTIRYLGPPPKHKRVTIHGRMQSYCRSEEGDVIRMIDDDQKYRVLSVDRIVKMTTDTDRMRRERESRRAATEEEVVLG